MATYTDNLGLKKPDGIDQVMVKDLNDNFDELDRLIASGATAKGLKPSGLYPTFEDLVGAVVNADVGTTMMVGTRDPYSLYTWTGAEWTYVGATAPVRGVDYWTPQDVQAIQADVDAATYQIDHMTVDAETGDHSAAEISDVEGAKHIHFTIEKGDPGDPGHDGETPYVGANGNWFVGETDTGVPAKGERGDDGYTPYIGNNGNWNINGVDTGISAYGEKGDQGDPGTSPHIDVDGNWFVGKEDTGVKAQGAKGDTGKTPQITFQVSTGAPGTDVQVQQGGTVDEPIIHLTIPRGNQGEGGGDVVSVNGVYPDENGNVTLTIPMPEPFELPIASDTTLGGVKIGENLSIDSDGVLAAQSGLPVGGLAGQVLGKASNKDLDAEWIDPPAGGVTGVMINSELIPPNEDGVVDLGSLSLGGDAVTIVQIGSAASAQAYSSYYEFIDSPENYEYMFGRVAVGPTGIFVKSGGADSRRLHLASIVGKLTVPINVEIYYVVLQIRKNNDVLMPKIWDVVYAYVVTFDSENGVKFTVKRSTSNNGLSSGTFNLGPFYGIKKI